MSSNPLELSPPLFKRLIKNSSIYHPQVNRQHESDEVYMLHTNNLFYYQFFFSMTQHISFILQFNEQRYDRKQNFIFCPNASICVSKAGNLNLYTGCIRIDRSNLVGMQIIEKEEDFTQENMGANVMQSGKICLVGDGKKT